MPQGLTDEELDALESPKGKKGLTSTELADMEVNQAAVPPTPKPTMGESGLRGAAQGATFGFSDEVAGGLGALGSLMNPRANLLDSYRKLRDSERAKNERARATNPGSYAAGEIGGGVASSFIPGMSALTGAKALNSFGSAVASGARFGALTGLGMSNADITRGDLGNAAQDVGIGAGTGAVIGGLTKGAIEGLKNLAPTEAAKKLSRVFFNTPEEVTDAYIQNPEAVKNAPFRYELGKKFEESVGSLKNQLSEGSQAARQYLNDVSVPGKEISETLTPITRMLQERSEGIWDDPARKAGHDFLKNLEDQYGAAAGQNFSGNKLKDLVQGIQRQTQYQGAPGQFLPVDEGVKKMGAGALNDLLKSKSPEYADEMLKVAQDAQLLDRVAAIDKSPQGMANLFRKMTTDQYGAAQIPREAVEAFDKRMGTDFINEMKNSYAREMLDKGITNGSRNVNLFSNMLGDIPLVGKLLGPVAGATVDKFGNKLTQSAVDAAAALNQTLKQEGAQQFLRDIQPLINAAKNANPAALATLQALTKSNPEALKYLSENE